MKKIILIILSLTLGITFSLDAKAASSTVPDVVYKQANKILLVNDILTWYGLENLHVQKDEYTGFGNVPGIYDIDIINDGVIETIQVNVRQTLSDVVNAVAKVNDRYHLLITKDKQLTKDEIRKALVNINVINASWAMNINHLEYQAYVDNWSAPGRYDLTINTASTSGLSDAHEISIIVSNSENQAYDFDAPKSGGIKMTTVLIAAAVIVVIGTLLVGGKKK